MPRSLPKTWRVILFNEELVNIYDRHNPTSPTGWIMVEPVWKYRLMRRAGRSTWKAKTDEKMQSHEGCHRHVPYRFTGRCCQMWLRRPFDGSHCPDTRSYFWHFNACLFPFVFFPFQNCRRFSVVIEVVLFLGPRLARSGSVFWIASVSTFFRLTFRSLFLSGSKILFQLMFSRVTSSWYIITWQLCQHVHLQTFNYLHFSNLFIWPCLWRLRSNLMKLNLTIWRLCFCWRSCSPPIFYMHRKKSLRSLTMLCHQR